MPRPQRIGSAEMRRRAVTGGASVLALDGVATVTYTDGVGYLLQVTDYRAEESAAIVLTVEQAADLAAALGQTGGPDA